MDSLERLPRTNFRVERWSDRLALCGNSDGNQIMARESCPPGTGSAEQVRPIEPSGASQALMASRYQCGKRSGVNRLRASPGKMAKPRSKVTRVSPAASAKEAKYASVHSLGENL